MKCVVKIGEKLSLTAKLLLGLAHRVGRGPRGTSRPPSGWSRPRPATATVPSPGRRGSW